MSNSLQLAGSLDGLVLKPIQPTQFWTFDIALSLLKSCHDPYILDALDEFLLLNKSLLFNPAPFSQTPTEKNLSHDLKEISLRNILYSDIKPTNIKDAEKIKNILKLDGHEVLRVISQTGKKIPSRKVPNFEKLKSKLPDDREKYLESDRLLLYTSKILRERRTVLKTVTELLNNKTNGLTSSVIQNLGREIFLSTEYIDTLIKTLDESTNALTSRSFKSGISSKLDDLIDTELFLFIVELSKVLIEILVQNPTITKNTTKTWFELMKSNNFVLSLGPYISFQESFNLLQGLSTIASILFLDLDKQFDSESSIETNPDSYLNDVSIFKSLNDSIIISSNVNSIILYTWSIILLRKYYILQEYESLTTTSTFLAQFSLEEIDQQIKLLNLRCVELDVFQDLFNLNKLLQFDNIYSAILSSVISAAMPLLNITPHIANTIESILRNCPNSVVQRFFDSEATINAIVLARAKFPLLLLPYLKLTSINGKFAFREFNELKSYISVFKKEEFNNLYQIDDENTELVKLTNWIDLYPPYEPNKKLSLVLKVGTKAKILPSANEEDVLVTFLYKYNGWAFLGRVLQNVSKLFTNTDNEKVGLIVQILNLLTKVVEHNSVEDAKSVLDAMSAYTDDSDILEVILRLLEQGLHSRDIDILEAVNNLLTRLMPFLSYRIWPYLAKSALLSKNGKEGFAATIYGAIEIVNGDFKFTISLVKLIDSLVQSCLTLNEDYPEKSKEVILSKLVNHLIIVFESFVHCRFNQTSQKMELGVLILDVFSSILATVHGADENINSSEKATKVFSESSVNILESFLVSSNEYSRSSYPILSMLETLSSNLNVYEITDISGFWHASWIKCSLSFSQLIVSIRSILNYAPSAFEKSLFAKLPEVVSIYSQYESFRKDVLDLVSALANGKWEAEPMPSLLSHLGRDYAQILLHSVATDLDNSFDDYRLKISLYDFICAVMGGNQQGLSVLFIGGRDVFGDFTKDNVSDETKPISLLNILKKNVRDIKYYPNAVSVHLLDAIALAFNSWTTARDSDNDGEFVKELIVRIQLPALENPVTTEEFINSCYEQKLISKIAEILSLFLFTTKNEKTKNSIVDLMKTDSFIEILKARFSIKNYRPLLHSNLHNSFEAAFPKYKLYNFTSTLSKRNRFGITTVYNLVLMDSLFKTNESWPKLREEIIASSINLQYLDSQISVAKSFGALITAYCRKLSGRFLPKLLEFVENLLKINIIEGIPADIFNEIYQERIELSFYLMYSIYHRCDSQNYKQVFEIIKVVLELLSSESMNFSAALIDSRGNYRPLLRILFCCLNVIKDDSAILIEYFSVFRDLYDLIVIKGTKTLLIEVQNDCFHFQNKKQGQERLNEKIADLTLILSILKLFMNLKTSTNFKHEMASLVDKGETVGNFLRLYSISHSVEVDGEKVFAQLSLMYVLEFVSNEVIAARAVANGLFVPLVETLITNSIRAGGVDISTGAQYHRIWTNGILPIIIMVLYKVGPAALPDVCTALQVVRKQTEYCIESWSRDSSSIQITSATVVETNQILLIYQILQSMNVHEYLNAGEDDVGDLKVLPGLDTASRRDDFVDCINNLLKHPKFLSSRVAPLSVDELRIIEKGGESFNRFVKDLIDEIRGMKDYLA